MLEQTVNQTNTQNPVYGSEHKPRKAYNIMSWVFISVTVLIFCMLIIIASIIINLVVTNRFNNPTDPQVYAMLVTAVTFIIMDICFMVIWFGLIIAGMIMGNKHKQLTSNKKLFNIGNTVLLAVFVILSLIVVILSALWLGGYYSNIDQRIKLVVAIAVLELIKAIFLIGAFAISIKILRRNRNVDQQPSQPVEVQNEIK